MDTRFGISRQDLADEKFWQVEMNRQVIPIDTSKAVLTIVRDSVTELPWRVNPLPANRGRGPGYRNGSNHNENQQDHNHPGMPPGSGMERMTNYYQI